MPGFDEVVLAALKKMEQDNDLKLYVQYEPNGHPTVVAVSNDDEELPISLNQLIVGNYL